MKYIVIELQTAANGAVANIVTSHDIREQAESKYHQILSSAAISELPCHAAVIMDSEGGFIDARCYNHSE
ncbi:MAG: hypothetical protein IKP01_02235 [Bacteroidales bacterium]|nr:hypothetical protein [Bacteroidales bacterium]